MINQELINPQSIVVVGGSNNVHKPGGRIVRNLIEGKYRGELYTVNQKGEGDIQGVKNFKDARDIPEVELAILSIPAAACPAMVEILAKEKKVKAFIVISAGFEETKAGAVLEEQLLKIVEETETALIGPNCIGDYNMNYHACLPNRFLNFIARV